MTELRMPAKYVDLSMDEVEYCGAWLFDTICNAGAIALGVAQIIVGLAGLVGTLGLSTPVSILLISSGVLSIFVGRIVCFGGKSRVIT